jgi:hypothetical protein
MVSMSQLGIMSKSAGQYRDDGAKEHHRGVTEHDEGREKIGNLFCPI